MQEKRRKWLPPYKTILLLSIIAALMVTFVFLYLSFTFLQAEKSLSRPSHLPRPNKNALRVLVTPDVGEKDKNPLEAGLLSYVSKKLRREVVPVQRQTLKKAENVIAQKEFDIAFTSEKTYLIAESNNYAEPLVIPISKRNLIPQTPISVQKDIDPKTKERIKKIFLSMNTDRDGKQFLSKLGIEKFIQPPE